MTNPPGPTTPSAPPPPNNQRAKSLWLLTAAIAVLGLLWFLAWFFYFSDYEWTDDAYSNGNMTNINPSIPGAVVAFYADDTDLVTQGQLLVQLDTTAYDTVYKRELATLASVVLQVRQLYDQVAVSRENVITQKIAVSQTRFDYHNRLHLKGTGAVSKEDFVHARDAFRSAKTALRMARYQLKVAIDAAGNTEIERHPLIEQQKGNIRDAYYNLQHCSIYAPVTGYVAQRTVDVGQWVTGTTNMMAIIPTDYVWVDANYKETQLTYMRVGQPAVVELDIYGSKAQYTGTVLGIASGTGSVFSIIPPQNATGNWIKIVQRLPVRISLDPEVVKKFPTRLGLSAEVRVDIRNQDLPMLTQVPPTKPVAITDVYNINFKEIEKLMDIIIQENLK
ncbi:MAG: efflux RND transporter periplasmic adaptor subunit [Verrucomicrobia bacterium]|nr:efflux RND transporter periplasmic adaptor subunit [Verrucomicrobiota bacterium]